MAKKDKKEVEKVVKVPEVIADGVVREVGENPLEDNDLERKPRVEGNWKKVSYPELVELEVSGQLLGYDPSTGEALLK